MANELIFNLDLDLQFPLSDYAFSTNQSGVIYFRAFQNNYIKEWKNTDRLNIDFEDRDDANIKFSYLLNTLQMVENENLFKLTLDPAMSSREGVYNGRVRFNGSVSYLDMDIVIFGASTIEMSTLLQLTKQYQDELKQYLMTAKKDMLDSPNGLALLDVNKKIKEEYLPPSYRSHINSNISSTETHKVKIDDEGIAWFFNGTDWIQWAGQPTQSPISPPAITVKDGKVTVKYDPKQTIARQKWDIGNRSVSYFTSNGKTFTGTTFNVSESGIHTLYYRDGQNRDFVQTFEVLETDIPYPSPTIKVLNGIVSITHSDFSKVLLQKWAIGNEDISYFATQGTIINNNQFIVNSEGTYTLYYKLKDGREYVKPIIISESMLPQIKMPTVTVKDGIVNITYDSTMNINESKWDFGKQDVSHFTSNGYLIANNQFEVELIGWYTIYFETSSGAKRTLSFEVVASELKQDPAVSINILNGIVTINYPQSIDVAISKWTLGKRDISYFATQGTVINNNTFTVVEVGNYTLYYKLVNGKEHIKNFTVELDNLPPRIRPYYSISNGNLEISVVDPSLYSANRYVWQNVGVDYFVNGGQSSSVVDWKIPLTQKGWLTHYYQTDSESGVYSIEIKNENLPHVDPTINIVNGLARVTHSQPSGVTVVGQKWSIGAVDISHFQTLGNVVNDNKFYVTSTGVHTLYYKLSHGGEYVMTFNVAQSQLEKPVLPPTVAIVNGLVTPTFEASMNVILKKWGVGTLNTSFFQSSGNTFTDSFTVPSAGSYTIYYKLDSEKDYVYHFTVTESDMQPAFPTPTITITRGEVTVAYDSSLSVESNKWAYGVNSVSYFESNGNIITDNKFTVTTAGQHSLYTVLTGGYKHVTVFNVALNDLPVVDPPPTISKANGIVTIVHASSVVVVEEQKWSQGLEDKEFFKNGGGTIFTGNTFTVTQAGGYSYYYVNSYGDDYLYHFNVSNNELPFYPVTITVFDALMTVEYSSPVDIALAKIATGSQTIEYFATQGDIVVDNRYNILSAGEYTFYWKQVDERQFISTFVVTESQMMVHTPPVITVQDSNISVVYSPEVELLVTEKKYDSGDRSIEWFEDNGNILASNNFTVTGGGKFTYFYRYRNRGYILNFIIPVEYLVPISEISIGQDIILGGRPWTKTSESPDGHIFSDDSFSVLTSDYGTTSQINPEQDGNIGKIVRDYYMSMPYKQEELDSIKQNSWGYGILSSQNLYSFSALFGMPTLEEALNRRNFLIYKGLTGSYWTTTGNVGGSMIYALQLNQTPPEQLFPLSTALEVRGKVMLKTTALVEKAPEINIVDGVVAFGN